jgi:outer membrane protein
MKSRILTLTILFSCMLAAGLDAQSVPAGNQSDSLTLKSIISDIIKLHPNVKGAEQALEAADARIALARTGYLPNIDAAANFSNIGPVIKITIPGMGSFQLYPENNYSAAVNFKETIYDFGRTKQNIEIEKESRIYGQIALGQVKQKMSIAAISNFYSLSFLQDAIRIKDEEIRNLNTHLKFVETKKATGSATDFELLTTQVRISNAESQKVDLQTAQKVQQAYLSSLLGLPENSTPLVKRELEATVPSVATDSLLSYAYTNRDEMLMNKKKISIAEMRYELTRTLNKPYLGFMASAGAKNGYLPSLGALKMNYALGVGLSVPIFDANRTKYNLQQSKIAISSLNYESESTKRTISSELAQAEAYVASAAQKVKQAELLLKQAEKAYSLAEISFTAGTITNLDLLDSSTAVSQARLLLIKSKIDYASGQYMLKAALGEKLY